MPFAWLHNALQKKKENGYKNPVHTIPWLALIRESIVKSHRSYNTVGRKRQVSWLIWSLFPFSSKKTKTMGIRTKTYYHDTIIMIRITVARQLMIIRQLADHMYSLLIPDDPIREPQSILIKKSNKELLSKYMEDSPFLLILLQVRKRVLRSYRLCKCWLLLTQAW